MKFMRLIAIAVAGAFAVPFAALAQGNPPAGTTAGSQSAGTGATGEGNASSSKLDSNKDGYLSRDEMAGDARNSHFNALDTNNDGRLSREEFNARSSGMGATGSRGMMGRNPGSGAGNMGSGPRGPMMGTPSGEPQNASPKGAN